MSRFIDMLRRQRLDDHRYYHQSRINQTLHLISAVTFLVCYAMLFEHPGLSGLIGWLAMLTRQTGHFFFEPNGYDVLNKATNEYKEAIKVGYNQNRKIALLIVWGFAPVALYFDPTLLGLFPPAVDGIGFVHHVGLVWLAIGIGGGLVRMLHLFVVRDVPTGLVWVMKVLTDPFHNIAIYYKSPAALLRGELIDTSVAAIAWADGKDESEAEQAIHLI